MTSREILESMLPKVSSHAWWFEWILEFFADTAAMWVNPSNLANLGPADVSITEPGANYSFNRIMIRSGNNSSNRLLVDSIFVADTTSGAPSVDTPSNTSACCSDGTCETGDANFMPAIDEDHKATTAPCASPRAKPLAPCCWTAPPVRSRTQVTASLWEERLRLGPKKPKQQLSPTGACCTSRWQLLPRHGRQLRSRWRHLPGIWPRCADVTCVVDLACCIGETCVALDQAVCLASGGNFVGGECTRLILCRTVPNRP